MRRQERRVEFEVTRAAIDRTALRGIERNGRIASAFGTSDQDLDPLFDAKLMSSIDRGYPLIFCLLAGFAPLWRVLEVLVVEELLFTDGPNEIAVAIHAVDRLVGKLWFFSTCL